MLKSLEILNNKSWELEGYKDCVINIEEFKQIKQDLEILYLIIKWKNQFTFRYDFDYLDCCESIDFENDFLLVENYLDHHFGYIPKCFKKVGDN